MRKLYTLIILAAIVLTACQSEKAKSVDINSTPIVSATSAESIAETAPVAAQTRVPVEVEDLLPCGEDQESFTDEITGVFEYLQSSGKDGHCLRGDRDMFWQEISGYFSDTTGEDISIDDMRFIDEFSWFEVQVGENFFYYPVFTYASIELRGRLPECQDVLRSENADSISYGDWFICSTDAQLEPTLPRHPFPENG